MSGSALSAAFADHRLRLLEVSWTASWIEDWLLPIAMSVYAYDRSGAVAAGLAGVVRTLPSASAAPTLGVFVDRWPRERVLVLAFAVKASACLAMAVAFWSSAPLAVLLILLAVEGVVTSPIQPAVNALLPWLAGSPQELTAANAAITLGRASGIFLGPLLAGILLATTDAGAAFATGALLVAVAMVLAARLRVARRSDPGTPSARGDARPFVRDMAVGFRVLASNRAAGAIAVQIATNQGLLRGMFSVAAVVVAVHLLGIGGSGAGYLLAASGLGGVIAGVTLLLRPGLTSRLADSFAFGIVLRTVPFGLLAATPHVVPALALMLVYGVGNTSMTTGGSALLQRLVPNTAVGRAMSATGMLTSFGMAAGAALAAPLLSAFGVHAVLVGIGIIWPGVALASWPLVRRAERRVVANDVEIEQLRRVPFMKLLPLVALGACAGRVHRLKVRRGDVVIHQGEAGDSFYSAGGRFGGGRSRRAADPDAQAGRVVR